MSYNQKTNITRPLKHCCAPAPYAASRSTICGQSFIPAVPPQQYGSPACRTRAQKWNRYEHIALRALEAAQKTPQEWHQKFNRPSKEPRERKSAALGPLSPTPLGPAPSTTDAPHRTSQTPQAPPPPIDEDAALAALGYAADPSKLSKERQQELSGAPASPRFQNPPREPDHFGEPPSRGPKIHDL